MIMLGIDLARQYKQYFWSIAHMLCYKVMTRKYHKENIRDTGDIIVLRRTVNSISK